MSQPERKRHDCARLRLLVGLLDDLRVHREEVDYVVGLVLGEEVGSDLADVGRDGDVGVVTLDRGQSDVVVLDVDTGLRGRV